MNKSDFVKYYFLEIRSGNPNLAVKIFNVTQ